MGPSSPTPHWQVNTKPGHAARMASRPDSHLLVPSSSSSSSSVVPFHAELSQGLPSGEVSREAGDRKVACGAEPPCPLMKTCLGCRMTRRERLSQVSQANLELPRCPKSLTHLICRLHVCNRTPRGFGGCCALPLRQQRSAPTTRHLLVRDLAQLL